ncbi:YciI family protein [Streptomyces zagrosensis]|uniref:Uncharacterized protein YciI n=1 Tax=Streptomyces zagrosensis TaxID=1042984 RepID=A0A7W9UZP7_9ACTN|nr:YciI family protein [Streptomyces zagrosensis]MBB5937275.1 uncharacterized protein YciI [Streptomyces zagrosensis]
MFVLELHYTAPLERIDALLSDHIDWLTTHYESGTFIASGRKEPRDGGVILAVGADRPDIEQVVANDPLVVAGACEYRITEFLATKTAPALAAYRQELPS